MTFIVIFVIIIIIIANVSFASLTWPITSLLHHVKAMRCTWHDTDEISFLNCTLWEIPQFQAKRNSFLWMKRNYPGPENKLLIQNWHLPSNIYKSHHSILHWVISIYCISTENMRSFLSIFFSFYGLVITKIMNRNIQWLIVFSKTRISVLTWGLRPACKWIRWPCQPWTGQPSCWQTARCKHNTQKQLRDLSHSLSAAGPTGHLVWKRGLID